MAVAPADLLTPRGRLERKVIWPGLSAGKVTEFLTAYLAEAAVEAAAISDATQKEKAEKAWAYYRAKDEQFNRMIGQPAQVSDADEGSQTYTADQIAEVKAERDSWRALFDTILEETGVSSAVAYAVITSFR